MLGKGKTAGSCYGSATVGRHGQVVIPAPARRELGIDVGSRFLVFKSFHGSGLLLIKMEAVEGFLGTMTDRLSELEGLVKKYATDVYQK